MINESRMLQDFLEYVQIPCHTLNERQIADLLTKQLTELGFDVKEDMAGKKLGGNTGNLIATRKGTVTTAPTLMLTAHMDCVEPCEGVKPVIKDGVITSDGTTILGGDDKAGVAAIMEALHTIQEQGLPCGDLQVVFAIAEEGGVNGSKNMDRELLHADMGFTFDTSGAPGRIVCKAPGQNKLRVTVTGTPAHAGIAPEKGNSAIVALAQMITRLPNGRIDEETTCNVGTISGGVATNIVAEKASLFMEVRSRNTAKLQKLTSDMVKIFEDTAAELGVSVNVEVLPAYNPFDLPEDSPTIKLAAKAATEIGFPVSIVESGGGSDASFYNAYGIPTCVLGVGMTNAHTKEECIKEVDLYNSARLALRIIMEATELKK